METTSPELSNKLIKLGITRKEQSTNEYLWWCFGVKGDFDTAFLELTSNLEGSCHLYTETKCPAFTLDELLEMLPYKIEQKIEWFLSLDKTISDRYKIAYFAGFDYRDFDAREDAILGDGNAFAVHENPAEAAGQLLVWCIENGYVVTNKEGKNHDNTESDSTANN